MMNKRSVAEAILGSFDGANTGLGLVLGLVAGVTVSGMLRVALPVAVAGTMSMALGELEKDNDNGRDEVIAMGAAWLVMCLLPVLSALVLAGPPLWVAVAVELAFLGLAITRSRDGHVGPQGTLKTYALIVAVAIPTIIVALIPSR